VVGGARQCGWFCLGWRWCGEWNDGTGFEDLRGAVDVEDTKDVRGAVVFVEEV
jgi:hypothetical protein